MGLWFKKIQKRTNKTRRYSKYYGPIFVHGDARGLLETKVITVDLNRDPIAILDNWEYISSNNEMKRIKVLVDGVLKEHFGIYSDHLMNSNWVNLDLLQVV